MPENECPTSTVGPSCLASTRCVSATASSSVVSGFCTEVTFSPTACSRAITSDQQDPSANSPWTRTMFLATGGASALARRGISPAVAKPASVDANVRRLIMPVFLMPVFLVREHQPAYFSLERNGEGALRSGERRLVRRTHRLCLGEHNKQCQRSCHE